MSREGKTAGPICAVRTSRRHHGAAITELIVVLPALLMLGLGVLQSALFYQAKTTASYATFEAARKGATTHAQTAPMLEEFGMRMAPIFGGDGSADKAMEAIEEGKAEALNPTLTRINIINPTEEAFLDFGVSNPATGQQEIPNTYLRYRDPTIIGSRSRVNIQDANLLKIQTTYGFELKVPLVREVVTGVLKQFDPGNTSFYNQGRIPIQSVATVRMQSAAWVAANDPADDPRPGSGVVPNIDVEGNDPASGDSFAQGGQDNPFGTGTGCDPTVASCIVEGPGNDLYPDDSDQGDPNTCQAPDQGTGQTARSTAVPDLSIGNPINVATGNKYQLETDIPALPGVLSLRWQRHYNSDSRLRGPVGMGWRHTYQVSARKRADDTIKVTQADGRGIIFVPANDGRYETLLASDGWLQVADDSDFNIEQRVRWHWPDGQTLQFNKRGDLTDIRRPGGEWLSLQYDDGHNLKLIKDTQDRQISLGYYKNGRIKTVTDPAGNSLHYRYDRFGNVDSVAFPDGATRQYHYEYKRDRSKLTGITNELGVRFATWEYDDQGRAIRSTHANGVEEVRIDYADDGSRMVTDSLGQTSTYITEIRQGIGVVTAIQGPGCSSCSGGDVQHEYNEQLQLVRTQRKDGATTRREYDAYGRLTRLTREGMDGSEQLLAAYEYDNSAGAIAWQPARVFKPSVNPDGRHSVTMEYTAAGQLVRLIEQGWSPSGAGDFEQITRETRLSYRNDLLVEIDGPRNDVDDVTTVDYDDRRRLAALHLPDGRILRVSDYDAYGRPSKFLQGDRQPVRLNYNRRGDITQVTERGQSIRYRYDAAGQLVEVTGPDGEALVLDYDAAGRAVGVTGPNGRRILSELDNEGRATGNQLLSGQGEVLTQISYLYDAQGRLAQIQRDGETTHQREYDEGDRVTSISDAAGNSTAYHYSSFGNLLAVTQPDGNVTRLAYDAKDRLEQVTDARDNATRYQRNDFGQVVAQHSPDTGSTWFAYDQAGNKVRKQDATGSVTTYQYDAANRMTHRNSGDGQVKYFYDASTGRLSEVRHAGSVERFSYNRDAQLTGHTREFAGMNFTTRYAYSSQGKLLSKKLPDGQLLQYHYHEDGPRKGTLRAITRDDLIGQTTIIGELNSNDTATLDTWTHGNGIEVRREHDGLGTPTALSFGKALALKYQYDEAGRIIGIEENQRDNWYQYDAIGQLLSADTTTGRFEYQYDEVGNRTQKSSEREGISNTESYSYAATGQGNALLSVNNQLRRYNAAGNPAQTADFRYEYNAQQRPVKVYNRISDKLIAEYEYNSFGARIKKVAYGASNKANRKTVTYYLYDGRKLAAEVNEDGDILAQYLYYKGQVVAKLEGREVYAVHTDHLGTPKTITDDQQNTVWHAQYTPFGEATVEEDQITFNLRLPGQYYDAETETHYNYYRDYEPSTGRYIQSDPIGLLGGINTYAYVTNNPLQLTDILGLAPYASGSGTEPSPPESENEYTQKLTTVFNRAVSYLKDDTKRKVADEVVNMLEQIRDAAPIIAGVVVVAAGVGVAVASTGIGAVLGVSGLSVAVGTLAAIGLITLGIDALGFLYDVIKIAIEVAGVDLDDCDSPARLDEIGDRLGVKTLNLSVHAATAITGLGVAKAVTGVGKVFRRADNIESCGAGCYTSKPDNLEYKEKNEHGEDTYVSADGRGYYKDKDGNYREVAPTATVLASIPGARQIDLKTADGESYFYKYPGAGPRGKEIENALADQSPYSSGLQTIDNYPGIDFLVNREVISVKSIDLSLPSANKPGGLLTKIRGNLET